MNFLHPWALVGLAGIGLPVVIHWLTKPRPVRLPLSTIRFVMQAVQQRRAKYRLRDWLVLLLRAAAVMLIAWAFARPLWGTKGVMGGDEKGATARVVILDQSASMGAVGKGISVFERLRPIAAEKVEYRSGLRANLILAGARARGVFEKVSSNVIPLREEVASAKVRPERLNVQAAINLAGEMLSKSEAGARRELVILSDFQRTNWASADFSGLPQDVIIQMESGAGRERLGNVGILKVVPQGRAEKGREMKVDVEVGNYSGSGREVKVEVSVGKKMQVLRGTAAPGGTVTLSGNFVLEEGGWQGGMARLVDVEDALKVDNSRAFVLEVRAAPTYVLVTRESSEPRATSSHFLERALLPSRPKEGVEGGRVVRVAPEKFDGEVAAGAEMIVVDHPGKFSPVMVNLLAGLMRRGKGVLYVAAENADATNLKLLMDAAGADMKMPVEFVPPPTGAGRRNLFIVEMRKEEAPFSIFGDQVGAAVGPLRFGGGLASRRLESGLVDDALATYSDRSACLVVTACGSGMLGVLNADLNPGRSNLINSPAFVPLLAELSGRILGQKKAEDAAVPCGEAMARYLPAEAGMAEGLKIVGPGGEGEEMGAVVGENNSVLWKWNAAGGPGIYKVMRGEKTVFAVASAVPGAESDLRTMDAAVMKERMAGGRVVQFEEAGREEEKKDRAWAWAIAACVVCLIGELAVLKMFRS